MALTPRETCDSIREILARAGVYTGTSFTLERLQHLCEKQLEREKIEWKEICPTLHVAYRSGVYIGHVDTSQDRDWHINTPRQTTAGHFTQREAMKRVEACGKES